MFGSAFKFAPFRNCKSCTINQIQNARSSSSNYQIDEFIGQLMTSEKFNELADIIAERAAKKINNKNNNTSTLSETSRNHKKLKNKKPKKEKQSDRKPPPDSMLRQRKEDNKSGFGRINIKAFLKRGASSQELFLNYKHMTKDLKKNLEKYEDKKGQRSENNNILSDHAEQKLDSKEKLSDSGSSELKHNKASKSEENVTKPRSFTSEEKHLNSEDKNEDTTPNTTSKEQSREHTQGKIDTNKKTTQQTKNDDISDASHSEIRKKENKENKSEDAITNLSKEVVEVGLQQALDNQSDEINEPTLLKIDYSSNASKETKQKKQIIRRENGKVYTYLSSSDYEEYHEDVRNQQTDNRFITFK